MPTKTILHLKKFPGMECFEVNSETPFKIFRVHTFRPSVTYLLRHLTPGKGEPCGIEPVALGIFRSTPNQRWRFIKNCQIKICVFL